MCSIHKFDYELIWITAEFSRSPQDLVLNEQLPRANLLKYVTVLANPSTKPINISGGEGR
jgi:hypothetical protein